jgi:hypothetical protein
MEREEIVSPIASEHVKPEGRLMSLLLPIEAFDNFEGMKAFPIIEMQTGILANLVQTTYSTYSTTKHLILRMQRDTISEAF